MDVKTTLCPEEFCLEKNGLERRLVNKKGSIKPL